MSRSVGTGLLYDQINTNHNQYIVGIYQYITHSMNLLLTLRLKNHQLNNLQ